MNENNMLGDPVCVVQARPVTVADPATEPAPAQWNPAAMAAKYVFKS